MEKGMIINSIMKHKGFLMKYYGKDRYLVRTILNVLSTACRKK